jgi:hypothetical protein
MIEFHRIWIDPDEAARDVREAFDQEKALGYLNHILCVGRAGCLVDEGPLGKSAHID